MVDAAPGKGHKAVIAAAPALAELYLSAAAIAGLAVLQAALQRSDKWNPVNRRFVFAIRVTMLLFAGRLLTLLTGAEAFRILELLAASMIALAVLLLTEGLLRRHAPAAVKLFVAGGAAVFGALSFWYGPGIDPARLIGLLVYQSAGLLLSAWLIIGRDWSSLLPQENRMVTRLGLSLVLLIPLAALDFLFVVLGLPIQLSALAVLTMCWLAIGLARADFGHGATLTNFLVIAGLALVAVAIICLALGAGRDATLIVGAVVLATMVLSTILQDARSLRLEAQSVGLLRRMAETQIETDPVAFLRGLRGHPMVEGAVLVSEESLSGLDRATLDAIFAQSPVLRRADPPAIGPLADDHIAFLFARYSATHILLARSRPQVLIALAIPSLGLSPRAELELQVVQRMAVLMADREDKTVEKGDARG